MDRTYSKIRSDSLGLNECPPATTAARASKCEDTLGDTSSRGCAKEQSVAQTKHGNFEKLQQRATYRLQESPELAKAMQLASQAAKRERRIYKTSLSPGVTIRMKLFLAWLFVAVTIAALLLWAANTVFAAARGIIQSRSAAIDQFTNE